MSYKLIREVEPHVRLYRDTITGVAWIHDGRSGCFISIHPNISISGSVRGMKDRGYWKKEDRIVRSHGFSYNIDRVSFDYSSESTMRKLEDIVYDECRCQACIERRYND